MKRSKNWLTCSVRVSFVKEIGRYRSAFSGHAKDKFRVNAGAETGVNSGRERAHRGRLRVVHCGYLVLSHPPLPRRVGAGHDASTPPRLPFSPFFDSPCLVQCTPRLQRTTAGQVHTPPIRPSPLSSFNGEQGLGGMRIGENDTVGESQSDDSRSLSRTQRDEM